jgi:hypothetical protein
MKKKIIAVAVAAVLSASAYAQNAILENEYIRAGVNQTTGTFGSGGNTSPGLLYNSTGSRTWNTSYDYLTPGSPFDGFSVKIDGTNYRNNNAGDVAQIAGGWTSGTTTSAAGADWTGTWSHGGSSWALRNQYSLPAGQQYIDISSSITAGSAASTVWFGRYIDPDARAAAGDSSVTDNVLGYGAIPVRNVAFSEALSSRFALGIYSANTNVWSGTSGWSTEADAYQTSKYPGANFGRGDDTIGLSWQFTGVNAGDTLTASYAYIFGPSAFGAASTAVTGGAGGGTPGTAPGGGTLVDVGSATSAASSPSTPSAPTVTGTTTVNGTSSFADTSGDSIVLSSSVVAGNYLTRNYNSLTTTEFGRITTTPRTIVTTYSDSTSTSAATTALTASETYYRGIDLTHNDIATGSAAIGDGIWVSNGIDSNSLVNTRSSITSLQGSKTLTVTATGNIAANELYTITTPTRFTYNRTTTTVTTNDFAPTSSYSDTTATTTATSTVTGDYNVVTNDQIARSAEYSVSVGLRTDQVATVNQLQNMINRNTEFGRTLVYNYYTHNRDGYTGNTSLIGVGHSKDIAGGMDLGFGINQIITNLSGNNSSVRANGTQLGATLSKKDVKGFDLSSTVQHTITDYNVSSMPNVAIATSGDSRLLDTQAFNTSLPAVAGKTTGNDTSVSIRAVGPALDPKGIVRPILGATAGYRNVPGYTATVNPLPDVAVSNTVNNINQNYQFATVGAQAKYGLFNAQALYYTDGVTQLGVGLSKDKENLTVSIRADRLQTNQGASNLYGARLIYRF